MKTIYYILEYKYQIR